eukprot:366130-Chlamydomonas_euryale.AAC.33
MHSWLRLQQHPCTRTDAVCNIHAQAVPNSRDACNTHAHSCSAPSFGLTCAQVLGSLALRFPALPLPPDMPASKSWFCFIAFHCNARASTEGQVHSLVQRHVSTHAQETAANKHVGMADPERPASSGDAAKRAARNTWRYIAIRSGGKLPPSSE